jgi:DHA2 family multidrug resistance protein-like MFS transporter
MPTNKATLRDWLGLAVIALPCMLYSMDLTVLFLAMPRIRAELQPSPSQLLWISDIYGFFLAGLLVTMGTLGDRVGRRKVLLCGAVLFGSMSVVAAFATSTAMLLTARALLGVAGATLAPSTLSLIRNMFADDRERRFAVGIWVASYSAGAMVGPAIGGVLLNHFWWGSVFLIAVPVMVLLLVLGPLLLPESRDPNAGKVDFVSAMMSMLAVLPVIYGVKRFAESGFNIAALLAIAVGLTMTALFIRRQKRLPQPLIDLSLFGVPGFSISLATYVAGIFITFGVSMFCAQYLQLSLGMTALRAGLWTMPQGGAFIIGSLFTPRLSRFVKPATLISCAFAVAAVALVALTQADHSFIVLQVSMFFLCLGVAPIGTLATDLIIASAPPERAGAASSISETGAEMGGALSIALLGAIATAVYGTQLVAGFALVAGICAALAATFGVAAALILRRLA